MKTFLQLKNSFLDESSKVKPLIGQSKEALVNLHYSKFPAEDDPELKSLPYKERMNILYAKDIVIKSSREIIKKDRAKNGLKLFKAASLKTGDYTNFGVITKINKTGVVFGEDPQIDFDFLLAGGDRKSVV